MANDLFGDDPAGEPGPAPRTPPPTAGTPRLRYAQRTQAEMRVASLDQLLPPEHGARVVWAFVVGLDLSPLLHAIRAVEGHAGRDATDPRLLLALWLYATLDGVGSAREVDRLCREHLAYQWLAGDVSLNYHTLAEFRTAHVEVLNQLLTDSVATLLHEGLIEMQRVAQDGLKVRAGAGASSFRREPTLQACLAEAEAQVQALQNQADEGATAATRRQQAARRRAAEDRVQRVQRALQERQQLVALRQQQQQEKGRRFDEAQARASTTDPEARRMHMPDGGTRPAYNVQFSTTTAGGVIAGVAVTNSGGDGGQLVPMLDQLAGRYGTAPQEALVDGGFTTLDDIAEAAARGTTVYGPVKEEAAKKARGEDPYQPRRGDTPAVAAWRQRMGTPAAQAIYKERAATAEWANAHARNRGLYQVRVRGQAKVLAVALLYALAHNLLRGHALRAARGQGGVS